MTIQELYDLLQNTLRRLEDRQIDDESKLELEILTLKLQRQILAQSFDPLQELDEVVTPDVARLTELTAAVEREIHHEQNREQLVRRILAIAKLALKASGVPIPI